MPNLYNMLYIGEVVDNKDPKKLGRLKVNVPNITGGCATDDLPWAEPCFPYSYEKQGFFFIPEIGSLVTTLFLEGSFYFPVWLGCIHRSDKDVVPDEINDSSYPERKIIKTQAGYLLFHDIDGKEWIYLTNKKRKIK